mgnify:FL=1
MSWPRTDISANRYINTYIKGFVDISGGPLYVRNGNVIDIDSVEIASNGSNTINFSNLDVSGIVAGSSNFQVASGGATTIGALLTVNDNITCTGNISASGTVTSSSDATLKDNVVVIPDALEKIAGLRGVYFTRNDLDDDGKIHIGVIAQEVEAVFPEVISGEEIKSVAYGNIVAPLIEAVKTLKSQNDELFARIEALETRARS